MSPRPYEPTSALRKSLAIVSATLEREHELAHALAGELVEREVRFVSIVLAEYLAQAIHGLALCSGDTAASIWQQYCLDAELAIARAESGGFRPS